MGLKTIMVRLSLMCVLATAQHYCLPPYCTEPHGVVGKYTLAASEPTHCYDWIFKYLNNVVPGSQNHGKGYRNTTSIEGHPIKETYDSSATDILAMESNECGLSLGHPLNQTVPMTEQEKALVAQGRRLPTGELHQCPCALEGRAHIINASSVLRDVLTSQVHNGSLPPISLPEAQFIQRGGLNGIFGMHSVKCGFHSSGPCLFEQVERGVARTWRANFSSGYKPLMDNNVMLWTPTLGPLLDLFLRDGVDFYPMRWTAPTADGTREVFSVLVSPCGKQLYEIAAPDSGSRPVTQFHKMPMARAVFKEWNEPGPLPLVPLRISRAVTPKLMNKVLEFYGATGGESAGRLGFRSKVLLDETSENGVRAVTLRLSESAAVHMQLWAVPETDEPAPWAPSPNGGFEQDFADSKHINQVTGTALGRAEDFCEVGDWSVARYTWYVLHTHEATLALAPSNTSTLNPPVGEPMNVFLDDHISWDCTAAECELSAGSRALFDAGSRATYISYEEVDVGTFWWPYSYDPAGYGLELHWYNQVHGFSPVGEPPPSCFNALADGSCPGSSAAPDEIHV